MDDNKNIQFTGDPVAFDGVEGKRDPKTGKGRFDLIPEEVFEPLFDRVYKLETTEPYMVECTPASILNDIANEKMLDAIIKITILKYYKKDHGTVLSDTEILAAKHLLPKNMEAGCFLECCWDMFLDLAIHFQKGAEHYGERNCQKGIPKWSFKDSAMRHAAQTFAGKTGEPHTISVVWNCWMFVWSEIHERQEADAIAEVDKVLEEMQAKRKAVKATILTGTRVPTPAEIEAAESATPTPELKTMKVQAALKEVREEGYVVMKPTWAMDTDELIKCVSELLKKKRNALKTGMYHRTKGSPEYDVFDREQQMLKRIINVMYTVSDDVETKTDDTEDDLEELRSFILSMKKFAEEHEFPIVTAIQHFYTREEVEAIKKEAAEKAIEDSLTKRENIKTIIRTIVKKFGTIGVHDIIEVLDEFDLYKGDVFTHEFVKFMDTQDGKERAMAWYTPIYLFNELIERVEEKQGQHDYHDFVPLLLQLNSTYAEFLNNDKS